MAVFLPLELRLIIVRHLSRRRLRALCLVSRDWLNTAQIVLLQDIRLNLCDLCVTREQKIVDRMIKLGLKLDTSISLLRVSISTVSFVSIADVLLFVAGYGGSRDVVLRNAVMGRTLPVQGPNDEGDTTWQEFGAEGLWRMVVAKSKFFRTVGLRPYLATLS
ncbi:hypothetical protein EIP91_010512 [Steccherinum ochraceum]|uniref:F-box domain-containing protein n=1 Tax=Steccherinum ochraceum TaxID=92696 RepID=A0A4R0R9M2_9APHY|nr:hypothetical protein EIP91_010512 [Steccherinum ochraceum]